MEIPDVTFDDVLKNGPEWGIDLLRSIISKEMNNYDHRMRALSTVKVPQFRGTRVEDMIRFLEYNRNGRKKK